RPSSLERYTRRELLGPRTWELAVRWTRYTAPCQRVRSVFSLCWQTPVRQAWLVGLDTTMTRALRNHLGLALEQGGSSTAGIDSASASASARTRDRGESTEPGRRPRETSFLAGRAVATSTSICTHSSVLKTLFVVAPLSSAVLGGPRRAKYDRGSVR